MKDQSITLNEALLDIVSREFVAQAFIKLCSVYKYIGIFI